MKSLRRVRASKWKTIEVIEVKDRISSLATDLKEGVKVTFSYLKGKDRCVEVEFIKKIRNNNCSGSKTAEVCQDAVGGKMVVWSLVGALLGKWSPN